MAEIITAMGQWNGSGGNDVRVKKKKRTDGWMDGWVDKWMDGWMRFIAVMVAMNG